MRRTFARLAWPLRLAIMCLPLTVGIGSLTAGCGGSSAPVASHCRHNADGTLTRLEGRLRRYRDEGLTRGSMYWARYDVEVARFVLTGGTEGVNGSGAACSPADRRTREWRSMWGRLQQSEPRVVEIERARGARFNGTRGGLNWVRLSDGRAVPGNDANQM